MIKKCILLAFIISLSQSSAANIKATMNLYKAIITTDMALFEQALLQGADVNYVDITTGYSPLMLAVKRNVELTSSMVERKGYAYILGILTGISTMFGCGLFLSNRNLNHTPTMIAAALGMFAGGITGGILGYKLFAQLIGAKTRERKIPISESIIYALCDHPGIKIDFAHPQSGKNIKRIVTDILNPFITNTYSVHTSNNMAWVQEHQTANFHLIDQVITVSPIAYQKIEPFYRKLSQHLDKIRRSAIPVNSK